MSRKDAEYQAKELVSERPGVLLLPTIRLCRILDFLVDSIYKGNRQGALSALQQNPQILLEDVYVLRKRCAFLR